MKPYPARLGVRINHWRELFGNEVKDSFTETFRFYTPNRARGSAAWTKEWKRYRRYVRGLRKSYMLLNRVWPSHYGEPKEKPNV